MKYIRLKWALVSFVFVVILDLVLCFGLTLKNGPQAGCGHHTEAGPCDTAGASLWAASWYMVPAIYFWFMVMSVGLLVIWKDDGWTNKKRNTLLLAVIMVPVILAIVTFIVLTLSFSASR